MTVKLSIVINDSLLNKIQEASDQMKIDKNEFIIKALKKYLLIQNIQNTRKRLKPYVKKQGFKSESEIFKAIS
jgi:metal-responsive CopG/Arc/MetJ family transcriptional regulator